MAAILEIRQADAQRFRLDLGVTCVGRASDNLIQITDASVSNRHCEIILGPDGTVIRDLGSTNGTFVAGQRVQVGCLNWDEPFRLGNVECVLRPANPSQPLPSREQGSRTRKKIDREGWKALGLGLGLAVVVCLVPLLAYIVDFLRVIIHETGHTVTDWVFGYPAIPMLRPGGAVSAALVRPNWIMLLMLAVLGKVLYDAYRAKRHPVAITIGTAIYLLLALSGLDRCVISAMGHGAELIVASLFLYRAVSGESILHRAERPLYATLAFVIFGLDVRFAAQLLWGNEAQTEYREGFEGQSHDLVRIAEEYLHVEFRLVVTLFLMVCLLGPCAVFLYHRCFGCARLNQRC